MHGGKSTWSQMIDLIFGIWADACISVLENSVWIENNIIQILRMWIWSAVLSNQPNNACSNWPLSILIVFCDILIHSEW